MTVGTNKACISVKDDICSITSHLIVISGGILVGKACSSSCYSQFCGFGLLYSETSVGCLCKLEHICMFKDDISENLMKYVGRFYDDSCCLQVILFQSKPREVSQYIALKTVISSFITINIYRTSDGVKSIFLNLFSIFRFMKVMKRY